MPRSPATRSNELALAQGDREATWRLLRGLGCDHATADELTQETLLRAVQEARRRGRDFVARRAWLFTVARHLFIDRCRARGRAVDVAWTAAVETDLAHCLATEAEDEWRQAARDCVDELAPRAARIVALFYAEDRSRRDIADELGMTEAGVKTALQRARQVLERCLRARMDEPHHAQSNEPDSNDPDQLRPESRCPNSKPNSSTPSCEPC
ncbi:MAG: sigma-70 family RNA polymerase sigma factor [bacterium]|nr:sigma-70 family RNA polymerase sigma factor [bacterium]